jgi:hypothetical protein
VSDKLIQMYYSPQYRFFLESLRDPGSPALFEKPLFSSLAIPHSYHMTQAEIDSVFSKPVYRRIIRSKAFQRLKSIHFLGSIDYVLNPKIPKSNKRHTRYQHSLGVARLALQFSMLRQLTERQESVCVVSALLHDIGHAPLSHSLESVFIEEYGIGHHIVAEKIILGDVSIGKDLHSVLIEFEINPIEIMEVINGTGPEPYNEIFNYAINIDTIEAILRSSTYMFKNMIFWPPHEVLNALVKRDSEAMPILDSFWLLKGEVYQKLINHQMGVLADYVCQDYMRTNKSSFFEDYYYSTEGELEKKHPNLFSRLKMLTTVDPRELLPYTSEILFVNRKFHINSDVPLDTVRSINSRYTQTKTQEVYLLQK